MLIYCPECNKHISHTVKICPHCGYKIPPGKAEKQTRIRQWLELIVLTTIVIYSINSTLTQTAPPPPANTKPPAQPQPPATPPTRPLNIQPKQWQKSINAALQYLELPALTRIKQKDICQSGVCVTQFVSTPNLIFLATTHNGLIQEIALLANNATQAPQDYLLAAFAHTLALSPSIPQKKRSHLLLEKITQAFTTQTLQTLTLEKIIYTFSYDPSTKTFIIAASSI